MPPVILGVIAGATAYGLFGYTIVQAVLLGVSVYRQLSSRQRGIGKTERAKSTVRASVEPAQWRLGITRYFGMLSQIAWSGNRLQFTLVLGEAPIQGVSRIWVNGHGIDITAVHGTKLDLTAAQVFADEDSTDVALRLDFRLSGVATDSTDMRASPWDEADGYRWTAEMTLNDLAFVVVYAEQNESGTWWRGIPNIEVRSTGYLWAPSGETAVVITNAAQVRRWWEMEREREPLSRIDSATYTSAVAVCTTAQYEIHGTVSAADDYDAIRDDFDFAWDGTVVDFNGSLLFLPGVARTQLLVIPPSDILDLPIIKPIRDLHDRTNQIKLRVMQSRTSDWLEQSLPEVTDVTAQTRDGGVLERDFGVIEYVTDPDIASRTARRAMYELEGMQIELTTPYGTEAAAHRYLGLAPGSIIGVNVPGLTGKRFRVDSTGPGEGDTLILALSEEVAERYLMSADPPPVPVPPTPVPEPEGEGRSDPPPGVDFVFRVHPRGEADHSGEVVWPLPKGSSVDLGYRLNLVQERGGAGTPDSLETRVLVSANLGQVSRYPFTALYANTYKARLQRHVSASSLSDAATATVAFRAETLSPVAPPGLSISFNTPEDGKARISWTAASEGVGWRLRVNDDLDDANIIDEYLPRETVMKDFDFSSRAYTITLWRRHTADLLTLPSTLTMSPPGV